jgi:hypothetical protein
VGKGRGFPLDSISICYNGIDITNKGLNIPEKDSGITIYYDLFSDNQLFNLNFGRDRDNFRIDYGVQSGECFSTRNINTFFYNEVIRRFFSGIIYLSLMNVKLLTLF